MILNTEGTEILTSPYYPYEYDNNIDAIWQIVAPAGHRVMIHFTDFSTEDNGDVVSVYDGWTSGYQRLTLRASLSGSSIPGNITSKGSFLWVRFISDSRNWYKGFRAELRAELRCELGIFYAETFLNVKM